MPLSLRHDRVLCATILGLTFFGLLMVFSATTAREDPSLRYIIKQLVAAGIGLAAMRYLMFRDYRDWRNQKLIFFALASVMGLLIFAIFFGGGAGTTRFLRLGGLVSFQPSELAKLALILFLAFYLESRSGEMDDWRSLSGAGLVVAGLCALVYGGLDLGTPILLMLIAAAILWSAAAPFRYFAMGVLGIVPFVGLAVVFAPYRVQRIMTFLNPEADPRGAGFQVIQSKIAVGSGGLFGNGVMLGRQKMRFLPEAHTDFIFAVIGEELGFICCVLVVVAFGVILWRGLLAAVRAPDPFGRYLATGVTAMIVFQAMINMGVVLGMLPTKGMTLPFISYGGSSLMICLAAAGLLLNVSQHREAA